MTTDPFPAGITEKRPFFLASGGLAARDSNVSLVADSVQLLLLSLFAFVRIRWRNILRPKSVFFGQKRLILIWEKGNFFFAQLFPFVARSWCPLRTQRFFGPKSSVFGPKVRFLPCDPKFCQSPVCSLRRDNSFPTFGTIFWLLVSELRSFS